MLHLVIPNGQTFGISGTVGAVHTGYVSYRIGKGIQETHGQFTIAHTGTGSATTLWTNTTGFDVVVTGWSLYTSLQTAVSIFVNSVDTGNTVGALPALARWTPQGIYNSTGQLVSSGSNGVDAVTSIASTTSRTIGLGSLAFTHASSTTLNWGVGSTVRVADTAAPTVNWVEGRVSALTTTQTTISVERYGGSGTKTSWVLTLAGDGRLFTEVRTGIALTANGTLTINATANGNFTDHAIYTNQITGGTTENDLIDITNACAVSPEEYFIIQVSRDNTAGTKTINFVGSGRTYNRSWLSGTLAIGVNEKWNLVVRATSATVFDVVAQRVA